MTSHYHHTWGLRQKKLSQTKGTATQTEETVSQTREQCLRQRKKCLRQREQCPRQRKIVPDRGNNVLDKRNSIPQKGNCSDQHPRQKEQYLRKNSVLDRGTVPQKEKITSQTEGTYPIQRKQCSNRGKGTKASKIEPGHLQSWHCVREDQAQRGWRWDLDSGARMDLTAVDKQGHECE